MSFILDALKKSEAERQPQSSAEFASLPAAAARSTTPKWVWLAGILLLINLLVLISVLLRPDASPSAPSSHSPSGVPLVSDNRSAEESFADQVETARRNPPPQQINEPAAIARNHTEPQPAPVVPTLISQAPDNVDMANQHPTVHELRASGTSSIPELHLDIHVFSEQPDERFVFINMSKHREGSQLTEGPTVEEITPLGVVLNQGGRTFLLPRE